MTLEDYDAKLLSQNNSCAICDRIPSRISLAVDHNHKSGRVRGLLCYLCNRRVLGRLERCRVDPRKIVAYFEKYDPDYLKQFNLGGPNQPKQIPDGKI